MMSTFRSLTCDGNIILPSALGISFIVCPAHICFGLTVVGGDFWCLAGDVALQAHYLILILFSEITNPDVVGSSLESDSWTPSNVGLSLKSSKEECAFIVMSLNMCRYLTLITLFSYSMWTL